MLSLADSLIRNRRLLDKGSRTLGNDGARSDAVDCAFACEELIEDERKVENWQGKTYKVEYLNIPEQDVTIKL